MSFPLWPRVVFPNTPIIILCGLTTWPIPAARKNTHMDVVEWSASRLNFARRKLLAQRPVCAIIDKAAHPSHGRTSTGLLCPLMGSSCVEAMSRMHPSLTPQSSRTSSACRAVRRPIARCVPPWSSRTGAAHCPTTSAVGGTRPTTFTRLDTSTATRLYYY